MKTGKWIALFLVCVFLLPAPALADGPDEQYEQALQQMRQGRYAEASASFSALGDYEDAVRLAMYCAAVNAGESGLYSMAVSNLQSLGGFRDADLLAHYYAALSYEAAEDYETAAERLAGYELYRDAAARLLGYPAKINERDYRKADEAEQAGRLSDALAGFAALGTYRDSAQRAAQVQEKISAGNYAAADRAEKAGRLSDALDGFTALGSYRDSRERAAAVREKIREKDYAAADAAEQAGDYGRALTGFTALGSFRDSRARAAAVRDKGTYALALEQVRNGQYEKAYQSFKSLGAYEDSAEKAYVLSVTEFAETKKVGPYLMAFQMHGVWGLADIERNNVTSPYWASIGFFNTEDLAQVSRNGKYGFIDRAGREVIRCRWDSVSSFSGGLVTVAVKVENNWWYGLYDALGTEITAAQWRTLGMSVNRSWDKTYNRVEIAAPAFSENRIKVQNRAGKWGFLDRSGKEIGQIVWDEIQEFSDGLALARQNGKYAYITLEGPTVGPVLWDKLGVFSEGLAVVGTKNNNLWKYGYMDRDGQVRIEPQYSNAGPFREGLAAVQINGKYQYIDQENRVVIQPLYSQADDFAGGRADVYLVDTGWQVIDRTGRVLYFIPAETREAYARAEALTAEGRYQEASDIYSALDGYGDSAEKMRAIAALKDQENYEAAEALREAGRYQEARDAFEALGGYSDAAEQIPATWYAEGEALRAAGDWNGAVTAFGKAGPYQDAAEQIRATRYDEGIVRLAGKDWAEAIRAFKQAGAYPGAAEQILYQEAKDLYEQGDYAAALTLFQEIPGYKDVNSLLQNDSILSAETTARQARSALWEKKGSVVTFGLYEQDGNMENGPEEIEWIILDVRPGKALLLSRFGLDTRPYNSSSVNVTWETCTLRSWLNQEFLNEAFSDQEQSAILTTSVNNSRSHGYLQWNTNGGKTTQDKIFLLSVAEANNYLGVRENGSDNENAWAALTAYAIKNGARTEGKGKTGETATGWWWLRSPGHYQYTAAYVHAVGDLSFTGVNVSSGCIRPVLWIDLDAVI